MSFLLERTPYVKKLQAENARLNLEIEKLKKEVAYHAPVSNKEIEEYMEERRKHLRKIRQKRGKPNA